MGTVLPEQVDLGCVGGGTGQARESKPVSGTPSWYLPQVLPPGSCL